MPTDDRLMTDAEQRRADALLADDDPARVRKFPSNAFVAGWALSGITLSMSLEFGTRWPHIAATTALLAVLLWRRVLLRRAINLVERVYGNR